MKKLFLATLASTFFAHIGLSDTYVWEDYDDFSDSSLDTSKWDVGYFSGGEAASTNGDVATLSGSGYTGSDLENVPSIWQTAAAQSTGQSNSGIFVKETDIYGIELEVSIPSSGNSQNVGFIVETHPADGSTYNGIELAWRENGLSWFYDNQNPTSGVFTEEEKSANLGEVYTLSMIHDGSRMNLSVNGERIADFSSNFVPYNWLIGSFNDSGNQFSVMVDNVRVLRRAITTSMDGSLILITSEDPVKETLVFENGLITSTFENPVDNEHNVQSGISYTLDEGSDASYKITLSDGDYYTFNPSTGTGSLTDYSNGQIDESGSWNFSFERFDWEDYDDFSGSSLDTNKWGTMYFYGGGTPTIENGKMSLSSGGLNLNAQNQFKEGWEQIIATWDEQDPEVFAYLTDESVVGISAEVSLPYDSSVGAAAHLNFNNLNSENGASIEIMYDEGSTNIYLEIEGQDNAFPSISAELGRAYKFSIYYHNDSLSLLIDDQQVGSISIPNLTPNMIGIGAFHDEGQSFDIPVDNVRVLRRSQQAEEPAPVTVVSDPNGKPVVVQVGDEYNWNDSLDGVTLWAVVDEQDGPPQIGTTTFENGNQLIAFEFLEQFDGSVTFLAPEYLSGHKGVAKLEISDSQEIEVSRYYYLNDNQVYVEETSPELYPDYSSSLREYSFERIDNERGSIKIFSERGTNEIILTFSDWESGTWSDYRGTGDWQCYDFTHSDVPTEYQSLIEEHSLGHHQDRQQIVSHPYEIDSNGYLKVTENTSIQYYNVVSVDNGIIGTIQDDSGVDSVADNGVNQVDQWFFTTLSAAQIFYNEKIDYAPESLDGLTVKIHDLETSPGSEDYGEDTKYFVSQQVYSWEENQLESTTFSYVKNSASSATLTIHHDGGATKTIHDLTFSSENSAIGTWTEAEETVTYAGTTTFTIIDEDYAPDYLNGWKLDAGASTYKFTGDSSGVFYDASDSNFSNRELSNITYTWGQIGPRIGKLTTSLGEETLLFFDSNTSGFFDWEEIGSDDGNSGQFELYYYPTGKAFESLVGSSISIGDTSHVFTSTNAVTVHSSSGKSSQEYAYLRENENEALLSVGSSLYKLDFYNHQYGRIIEGGSGYFSIQQNWATKGWVYYDDLPWIYSNNQGEWMYQVLSINNETNETELMYFEPWTNLWSQNLDLKFTDKVFSADSEFYWEDYDDFSGPELNSSEWDVAWWDGGTAPSIDQANNRVEFTKGSSYEANLSDMMNLPNPNAESEYSYGYDASYGFAPSTIADMNVRIHEEQILPENSDYGVDYIYYSDGLLSRYDWDEQQEVQEPYLYQRTGPNTAKITMQSTGELYVAFLTFTSQNSATGTWEEQENGATYSGSLTFDIVFSPHSLLEFVQSDDIDGIEFELMIPNGAPDQTCIGLFAVDYNAMFNASSDEQEEGAMKFDLDLCYFNGLIEMEFNHKDTETGEENSTSQSAQLGVPQKIAFYYHEGRIYFFHNDQPVKDFPYERGNEKFVIRAQNELNLDFSAYLKNVRVLRKKSYPQGWMWTNYYPWAYSHETGGWLYFELAKDSEGNPVMNYYDHNSGSWDLYGPSLNKFTDR